MHTARALAWPDRWTCINTRKSIVALGRRVADACDLPTACSGARVPVPAILTQWRHNLGPLLTYAPHPSGSSQALNDPAAVMDIFNQCVWDGNCHEILKTAGSHMTNADLSTVLQALLRIEKEKRNETAYIDSMRFFLDRGLAPTLV